MKKLVKVLIYSLALLFILLTAAISFLLDTNTGLYTSLRLVNWVTPGKLTVKKATGTLSSNWRLNSVNYDSDDILITLDVIEGKANLLDLIKGRLMIDRLKAGHLSVINKENTTEKPQQISTNNEQNQPFQLPIDLTIADITIKRLTYNQAAIANIQLKNIVLNQSDWQINQIMVDAFNSRFKLSGHISQSHPHSAKLTLSSKALQSGGMNAELIIKGNWSKYEWQGYMTSPASVLTSGHIKHGDKMNGQINWRSFTLPGKKKQTLNVAPGELVVNGDFNKLAFHLNTALVKPIAATIKADGYHTPTQNEAMVIFHPDSGRLNLTIQQQMSQDKSKFMVQANANNLDLSAFDLPITRLFLKARLFGTSMKDLTGQLAAKGRYRHKPLSITMRKASQQLHAVIKIANNQINIDGRTPFPLTIRGSLPSPHVLSPALDGLKTQINLSGKFNSASDGRAQLSIQSGQYQHPTDSSILPLAFSGGNVNLHLSNQGLYVSGKLAIDRQKTILAKLKLPNFRLMANSKKPQTISGQLSVNLNSLAFLSQLSPAILNAKGKINAQINVSGQLPKPNLNGKIVLSQGSFKTTHSDTPFEPVTATLTTTNHQWQLNGSVSQQSSQLSIKGSGKLTPNMAGQIKVSGNRFLVMNNKEYQVYISPNIAITMSQNQTKITGDITVPKARISPQTFSSTVTLSDDVVFANQSQQATESNPFNLNLNVTMGDDVRLFIEGLSAKVIGSVRLQKQSNGTLNSSGQLSVSDGQYEAYGQKLTISQGELLFAGGSISNPGINIRATRTFNTTGQAFSGSNRLFDFGASNIQSMSFANVTTVGIQVSGRINNPKVTLFSEPANLQQSDILSMLLLGRPAGQASDSGGQLLLSAITSMGLDRGTEGGQLLSQLQNKLGLEFGVDNNTTYDRQEDMVSSSHSLGVKKKFSDRLSIGYNMGIYDSNSMVLTLTYLLNKYLSIQVNASDNANGIDLTYTRSKD